MIEARKYYEFSELLSLLKTATGQTTDYDALKSATGKTFDDNFKDVYENLVLKYEDYEVIYRDFYNLQSEPEDLKIDDTDVQRFLKKIVMIYNDTQKVYNELISYYDTYKEKLMDKVESESVSRFNDTPQNGGLFEDDGHTSTITQATSKSDVQPYIDRLDGIRSKLVDVKAGWQREFEKLFMLI